MVVTEVHFESKKKKVSDEITGKTIAEYIKYNCVFYDDNRCKFVNAILYESQLCSFKEVFIERIDGNLNSHDNNESYESLIEETKQYSIPEYIYGNIVYFKTKKFELFKKRSSIKITKSSPNTEENTENESLHKTETIQYIVNYSTPDFVISGFKKEQKDDLYYPDGSKKKIVPSTFFKIKWFNSCQMKFSETFLPVECLIDTQPFKTKVAHNK